MRARLRPAFPEPADPVRHTQMPAEQRNRSIRVAVLSSLVCKAGTALLQLLALPLALRVLGWEEFGLYASVAGLLSAVYLFEIGLGPALTHGLSQAAAVGDRKEETILSSTAFFLLGGLIGLGGLVFTVVLLTQPPARLFGAEFAAHAATLRPALWTGLGLMLASMLLNHTDRLREGYLEVLHINLWGAAGNFVAAVAVVIGVWRFPSVTCLLLAVFGPQLLGKLANTWQLWRARPWIIPRWQSFRSGKASWMLRDGLAFAVFSAVVNLVEFNVIQNLYGRVSGPEGVTAYSIFVTLTISQLGFIVMLTTPTWPAVVDAAARGEVGWIRSAVRRLGGYAVGFSLLSGIGLVTLGPWLLPLWLGPKAEVLTRPILLAYAGYFLLFAWRHVHHMLLVGLGQVRLVARVQLLESALILATAWLGMTHGGLATVLLAMTLTLAALTGWWLPWLVRRQMARLRGAVIHAPKATIP